MRKTLLLAACGLALLAAPCAQARITRLENLKVETAFGGKAFGPGGAYERVTARAHGEVDPKAPGNAIIQDIALAPRNARGMVEYETDIDILRPADPARSNGIVIYDAINRGNKLALGLYNADVTGSGAERNALTSPGDGFLQQKGITVVFYAWQGDVHPGDNRMLLKVPVAHNADGSAITGTTRSEIILTAPATTVPLGAGWFTTGTHASYPTAEPDNTRKFADGFLPTLTERERGPGPRVGIANSDWHFGDCDGTADATKICYPAGFKAGHIYELIYRAKDPTVLGLGFAVTRDLATFLRGRDKDDAGTANPVVHGREVKTIITGSSQSGRFIRTFLLLGFNKAEGGGRVFDGAIPHIGGGLAWGSTVDHEYPAYDFPFTYARQTDPLTGRTQGVLDRCTADNTCPRIFHAATALEVWDGRQALGLTDPLGRTDAPEPANVRTYVMASTQHAPASLPLPAKAPFGVCVQQSNPMPYTWTMRALLEAHIAWLQDDKKPPASSMPRIADGTLVAPDEVRFPAVPANAYGGVERPALRVPATADPLHVFDRGPLFRPSDSSGIETIVPPRQGTAAYGVLVPQVDADGNDIGGIRTLFAQVPIGTYTGWNQFRSDWFGGDGFCELTGSFVPFAATKAEREAAGDSRPSLEERYPSRAAYLTAMRVSADRLITARFLRPDDAYRLLTEAEKGVRSGP
jgi:hypothetical protein